MAFKSDSPYPFRESKGALRTDAFIFSSFNLKQPPQEAGELGHSLVTDLLEEFGPDDDARDALGLLYLGVFWLSPKTSSTLHLLSWCRYGMPGKNVPTIII
jgi:hypothetical protein